jgi:type III secretion protein D
MNLHIIGEDRMELRMLSGLHRGAVLELDEEELLFGASDQADVLVADSGVAARHLSLRKDADGYLLVPEQGVVLTEDNSPVTEAARLAPGMRFSIGEVWIGFYGRGDPWQGPPAPAERTSAAATEPAAAPEETAGAGQPQRPSPRWRKRSGIWFAAAPLFISPLLIWLVATAHASFNAEPPRPVQAPAATAATSVAAPAAAQATLETLAAEFKRQLSERDLLDRVDLSLAENRWEVRGTLDADEEARLMRLVNKFSMAHKPPFPIDVMMVPLRDMLPFRIIEVTTGKYGNVVTDSGERVFVGDTLEGYRLVSVAPSKIVFNGKRRIELPW